MAIGIASKLWKPARRLGFAVALLIATCAAVSAAEQPATENATAAGDAAAKDSAESLFPGCAALKTDTEYPRLLNRAAELVAEGRPDLAAVLWQKVIDEAGDALVAGEIVKPIGPSSLPLIVYRPVWEHVEEQMRKLPPAALAAYRTSADAEARAVLAAAASERDEQSLREVVRRFFCSSIGDDAAFKLACLALDRHDFVVANRLLSRLLQHPYLSISKVEILARLAVAAAYLQDQKLANESLQQLALAQIAPDRVEFVGLIKAEVAITLANTMAGAADKPVGWPMLFGNAARAAQMPSISPANIAGPLSELWVQEIAIPATEGQGLQPGDRLNLSGVLRGDSAATSVIEAAARDALVRQWRDAGWRPTGRLLFDGGRAFAKSADRLLCLGAENESRPIWQSAWENRYELDPLSRQMTMVPSIAGQRPFDGTGGPDSRQTIWMFGDRVQQSMAIVDGVIYSLEGRRATVGSQPQAERNFAYGSTPRRSRGNWLTAYHTRGGKAIWTRPAGEEEKSGSAEVGFLAAPTQCGSHLLVPITDGGTMWLVALDTATGKTLWKTFLCDEPQSGASPWAEIVIAASGDEAYLTCGYGVVFAIDTTNGQMRWAVRYARAERKAVARPSDGETGSRAVPRGWDDDVAICQGRLVLVMSSDSDQILALDRRTGQRVWESPRVSPLGSAASYCLGIRGGSLYVAGKNVVRKYEVATGRLNAERQFDNSLGRGCLTTDDILIPVGEHIERLDLNLASPSKIQVALTRREPIGNLFSDGQRLWVVEAGRVYVLTALKERLELLEDRIARGETQARLERARLNQRMGRTDLMVEDLRAAYRELAAKTSAGEAAGTICDVIAEQRLAHDEPISTLQLLADVHSAATAAPPASSHARRRSRELVGGAISNIRQRRPVGSVEALLKAAALYDEDYLLTAAELAVDAVATNSDGPTLLRAMDAGDAAVRLIAMKAGARLEPGQVKIQLARRLSDRDDRVRLAAVRTLASLGQRSGVLEALVALLESPDLTVRSRAQQTLQALTRQTIPFAAEGAADDRAASIRAWRQWIAANSASAKLNLPLVDRISRLGRTLIVSPSLLVELDSDHKERLRLQLPGAAWGCQGLPNGNRLVAINSHSLVIEYDEAGKEVWRKDRLPAPPTTVQRLDGGSTLLACPSAHQIVEVGADGSISTTSVSGEPISAQRLDNGNTLVALQDAHRVAEVTSSGRAVWEVQTSGPPAHAVRLDNGNTLVTLPQARKVVEYDATGNSIVWMTGVPLVNPAAAQRLPNGNTLVGDHTGVIEIDATGKQVVWRYRQPQVTGLSAY